MENDTLATMGQRMATVRRQHNTTQEALADLLDVSPKHISHCENATSYLSLKNLINFCHIFDCSLDYLDFGSHNDSALSRLPDEIIKILQTGTDVDIDRLNRYLQIYVELQNLSHNQIS